MARILAGLRRYYGAPDPPPRDPFELILRENVAYLASDAKRDEAFRLLHEETGLSPAGILSAPRKALLEIAGRGILPAERVDRLREIASIAVEEFAGDLDQVVRRPPREASRALRRFPSIGAPGAEKILLFSRRVPALALESNGLRALLRLGYGKESASYSASYKSAQAAASAEIPEDFGVRIEAHQLLRRHGQEICRRSRPICERCPVTGDCAYYAATQG
jgi:endonuclease III